MSKKRKEKQGCLSILFPALGRKTTKTIFTASSYKAPDEALPIIEANIPEVLPYRVRDDFLSPAEFSFYKILSSLSGTHLTI